jgi:hypothetical protein
LEVSFEIGKFQEKVEVTLHKKYYLPPVTYGIENQVWAMRNIRRLHASATKLLLK